MCMCCSWPLLSRRSLKLEGRSFYGPMAIVTAVPTVKDCFRSVYKFVDSVMSAIFFLLVVPKNFCPPLPKISNGYLVSANNSRELGKTATAICFNNSQRVLTKQVVCRWNPTNPFQGYWDGKDECVGVFRPRTAGVLRARVCVRACVRACVCVCVRVCTCVCVCACVCSGSGQLALFKLLNF